MKKGNSNSKMVSIIMPVYNCDKTVSESIESVLSQDYKDYELIIVNDGSKDNTQQVCESFTDSRIKIFSQPNSGPSSARNLGIDKSSGKYLMFIDADDEYMDNTLSKMVEAIENFDCDMVVGNYVINDKKCVDESINSQLFFDKAEYIDLLLKFNICNSNWNKIYKRSIVEDKKIHFDENYNVGEDLRFNFKYFEYMEKGFYLKDTVYSYNISSTGLTLSNTSSKPNIEVELLNMMYDFYIRNNYDLRVISRKIATDFFYINDISFVLNSSLYLELLKVARKNNIYAKILYVLVKHKSKRMLYFLIWLKRKIKA